MILYVLLSIKVSRQPLPCRQWSSTKFFGLISNHNNMTNWPMPSTMAELPPCEGLKKSEIFKYVQRGFPVLVHLSLWLRLVIMLCRFMSTYLQIRYDVLFILQIAQMIQYFTRQARAVTVVQLWQLFLSDETLPWVKVKSAAPLMMVMISSIQSFQKCAQSGPFRKRSFGDVGCSPAQIPLNAKCKEHFEIIYFCSH